MQAGVEEMGITLLAIEDLAVSGEAETEQAMYRVMIHQPTVQMELAAAVVG
jgi:hypothetical protein